MLRARNVRIFVRRGGPNYQEGLTDRSSCSVPPAPGISLHVYGPGDAHHFEIVLARALSRQISAAERAAPRAALDAAVWRLAALDAAARALRAVAAKRLRGSWRSRVTDRRSRHRRHRSPRCHRRAGPGLCCGRRSIRLKSYEIYELATAARSCTACSRSAVQGMLDFDLHLRPHRAIGGFRWCFPFAGRSHYQKFYWGAERDAHAGVREARGGVLAKCTATSSVLVNFASFRSGVRDGRPWRRSNVTRSFKT
jgi:ATP citrate (pro-S)-lyase